ncbi:MAG: lamin tail domain-containing protein, partial [Bacteroidota bacterium]
AKVDAYANLLDSLVQADPYPIYSYGEFTTEVNRIKNFLSDRHSFLSNYSELNVSGLDILDVNYATNGQSKVPPNAGEGVQVSARFNGSAGLYKAFLYYGSGWVGAFQKVEMLDDGNHNDGVAGDGIYGADIPAFGAGTYVRYYIEAQANDSSLTATYMPQGAEHDVYIYQVKLNSANSDLVINEFMASNNNSVADSEGDFDDWIELYNLGSSSIDLGGYFLSDDGSKLTKWQFPIGTTIDANDYLIIWADNEGSQSSSAELHADFKISAGGEALYLLDRDSMLVDRIVFSDQISDQGYARVPNGIGSFTSQNPTFADNNDLATSVEEGLHAATSFVLYPNPSSTSVWVTLNRPSPNEQLKVYDIQGRLIKQLAVQKEMNIDLSNWAHGLYYVQYQGVSKKLIVQH